MNPYIFHNADFAPADATDNPGLAQVPLDDAANLQGDQTRIPRK